MKERSFILLKQHGKTALGYTTGSCAAAAAGAAAEMLATGNTVHYVSLHTPKGIPLFLEIEHVTRDADYVSCAVQKDGGADSDVTDGLYIYATVRRSTEGQIRIDGGEGVGRVTLPGLDQPVGNAAINHVPREMIAAAVSAHCKSADVVISIPGGAELAAQTFNPKLGIVGGISVLGTSGIVEPMSEQALLDTIGIELHVRRLQDFPVLLMAPGNYGREFVMKHYGLPMDDCVACSNFVAESIECAAGEGFSRLLFIGHIGKLVKVAGGVRNTHSRYGDRRMEILSGIARDCCSPACSARLEQELASCVSTDEAVRVLQDAGAARQVLDEMTRRICRNMQAWAGGMQLAVIVFSNVHGVLGQSDNALPFVQELRAFCAQRKED